MKKSIVFAVVTAIFLTFLPVNAADVPLSDISGDDHQVAIEYLYSNGVIGGYPDGTFKPANTVNRAELLKILVGGTGNQPTLNDYKDCFPDVKSEWFAPYVCFAKNAGWVEGYLDGSFKPAQTVNKVEAIKMVDESQGYKKNDTGVDNAGYSDVEDGQWFTEYVEIASERNLLEEEGVLGIADGMARGGISEMIYRAMLLNEITDDLELFVNDGESSSDLIDADLAAKKIDLGTAYLYKLYALYNDEKLPAKYESDVIVFAEDDLIYNIRADYEELSADDQAAIDPFLLRPEDPDSYLSQRYGGESTAFTENGLVAARPSQSLYTASLITNDSKVRIWYPNKTLTFKKLAKGGGTLTYDVPTFIGIATKMKQMLDTDGIITRYADLLDRSFVSDGTLGGDGMLDIYISPLSHLGLSTPDSNTMPSSGSFQVNPALWDKGLKYVRATVSHELFHIYQYAFKQNWDKDHWWREATATWAMEFIYPNDNFEQIFLKRFLPYPDVTLNVESPPGLHAYATYIFALYLTNNFGNDIIRDTWEECETLGCLEGIDAAIDGGYKTQWRKFTLWNFNRKPVRHYVDKSGYFPGNSSSEKSTEIKIDMTESGQKKDINTKAIKPLAAQVIKLADEIDINSEVKKVTFKDFSEFTLLSDKASIYAVIYSEGGTPKVEEWTDKLSRSFCLDLNSPNYEDFSDIYLIFANGETTASLAASKITAEASNTCGGNWEGALTITGNYNGNYECDWGDSGNEVETWTLKINEELAENKLLDAIGNSNVNYDIVKQNVKYTYNQTKNDVQLSDYNEKTTYKTIKSGSGNTERSPDYEETMSTELGDIVFGRDPRFIYFQPLSEIILNAGVEGFPDDQYQMKLDNLGGNLYGVNYGLCDFVNFSTIKTSTDSYGSDTDTWLDTEQCNESYLTYEMQDDLWSQLENIDPPTENGTRFKGKITLNSDEITEGSSFKGNCDGDNWNYNVVVDWDYKKG